jgi:hypothetical protein
MLCGDNETICVEVAVPYNVTEELRNPIRGHWYRIISRIGWLITMGGETRSHIDIGTKVSLLSSHLALPYYEGRIQQQEAVA